MILEELPNPNAVAERAAELVAEVLAAKSDANLVLPTGQTPIRMYRELVQRSVDGHLDMSACRVFQLDELVGVPTDDQRSYHAFLRRTLVDHLDFNEEHLYLLNGCAEDLEAQIADHARTLREAGGADLVVLGLGRNGHIAFNEPGREASSTAGVVDLHRTTVQMITPHFEGTTVPDRGLTLGVADIIACPRLLMIVTGATKAVILKSVLEEVESPNRPASLLRDHASITILADAAASSLLGGEAGEAAHI